MLVSYNSEGFGGLTASLSKLKEVPPITNEVEKAIKSLKPNMLLSADNFQELAESLGTTDKNFINFLKTSKASGTIYQTSGEALAAYQRYLQTLPRQFSLANIGAKALSVTMSALSSIGWMAILSIGTTLLTKGIQYITGANERFLESQQKIIDNANDSIAAYDTEISSLNDLQQQLQNARGNKQELAAIQSNLNDFIGNTPGLLNNESGAWEIANQKLTDRIARLKELRQYELDEKVNAQKEIFNHNKVDNEWGIDHKFDYFTSPVMYSYNWESINHSGFSADFESYVDDDIKENPSDMQTIFDNLKKNGYGSGEKSNAQIWKELIDFSTGTIVSVEELQAYFDEQTKTAQELFAEYLQNSDSIFSPQELNDIIRSLVESGYSQDLEGIQRIITDLINDDHLSQSIDSYYESLFDNSSDSNALYENVKKQFEELEGRYPELKEILENFFNNIGSDIKTGTSDILAPKLSNADILNQVQSLSTGLSQLGRIYSDVSDQESFDWSSILNNEEFEETFGNLGNAYDDFIDTISNHPSDINACQDAFNNLSNAYIYNSGALKNVTEETKDAAVAMLEQMGVENALDIVEYQLASSADYLTGAQAAQAQICAQLAQQVHSESDAKYLAKLQSIDLANATSEEIQSLITEADHLGISSDALVGLQWAKLIANSTSLNTTDDINALIQLAYQANLTSYALSNVKKLSGLKTAYDKAVASGDSNAAIAINNQMQAEANKVKDNLKPAANYAPKINTTPSAPRTGSTGSSPANAASPMADAAKPIQNSFYAVFDWMERKIKYLERIAKQAVNRVKDSIAYASDSKYVSSTFKKLNAQMSQNAYMANRYTKSANDTGLAKEWKDLIKNGGKIDYSHIHDESLSKQINAYEDWYKKMLACKEANEQLRDTIKEVAKAMAQAPIDKYAAKVDSYSASTKLFEAKIKNQTTAAEKNDLIDNKIKNVNKTKTAYKNAYQDTKKNVSSYSKKIENQKVSKKASKKQQKNFKNLMAKVKSAASKPKAISDKTMEAIYSYCASVGSFTWYQNCEAYNSAVEAFHSAEETYDLYKETSRQEKVELAKEQFDNVAAEYNHKIQMTDYSFSSLDNKISEIKASGASVNQSYYKSQKTLNNQKLAQYQAEKAALEESIKNIKQGTDAWYEAYDEIQQVNSSISDCVKETYELNNAINELNFDLFNDISDSIGRIITEQEFLQSLFAHEKTTNKETGNLTEAGLAKLGSLSSSYYASKNRAEKDAAMVKDLQTVKQSGKQSDGSYKLGKWEFNSLDDLQAKIDETYTTWQDDIKDTYSIETEISDLMKEKYQAELDLLKDLIDAKKEALNAEKDLHDYQRTIQEKTNDISTIQKQIAAYSGDTSQEGFAKLQKLQKELADKENDLRETEYEKYISDQQDMLDKLYEEYEELITKKLDDFYALVNEGLTTANDNTSAIESYLSSVASANGYTEETRGLFNGISGSIQTNVDRIIESITKDATDNSGTASTPSVENGTLKTGYQQPIVINRPLSDTLRNTVEKPPIDSGRGLLEGDTGLLSIKDNKTIASSYIEKKLKSIKFPGFKKGGIVSVDDIEKQVKANGDTGIVSVNNGESILTSAQTELLKRMPIVNPLLDIPTTDYIVPKNTENNVVNIDTLTLPNVKNYDEFKTQMYHDMQKDKPFETMINNMTVNKLMDGGRLGKYRQKL